MISESLSSPEGPGDRTETVHPSDPTGTDLTACPVTGDPGFNRVRPGTTVVSGGFLGVPYAGFRGRCAVWQYPNGGSESRIIMAAARRGSGPQGTRLGPGVTYIVTDRPPAAAGIEAQWQGPACGSETWGAGVRHCQAEFYPVLRY
eukprot:768247-Hanusia_phi.AAC.4